MEASAKINTGFTVGPSPMVRLPRKVAEQLGFNIEAGEDLKRGSRRRWAPLPMRRLGVVEVMAIEPDRQSQWVRAVAVYTGASTLLINDYLTEELEIEIIRPGTGLWRFRGEDVVRRSAEPSYYE